MMGLLSTETFLQSIADMELITIGSAADEIIRIQNDKFAPKPRGVVEGQDKRTSGAGEEGGNKNDGVDV
jgi:hypothetical protein